MRLAGCAFPVRGGTLGLDRATVATVAGPVALALVGSRRVEVCARVHGATGTGEGGEADDVLFDAPVQNEGQVRGPAGGAVPAGVHRFLDLANLGGHGLPQPLGLVRGVTDSGALAV